ncbi:MarR family transcriptional regulator [Candidatus Bathyarchaeota archaeon]|nr:MarR family transcriptional regulator [Candidatus Bathyarchaeota archaeon]
MPLSKFEALVLMALAREGSLTITGIRRHTGISPSAVYTAVRGLRVKGLVVEEQEKEFPFRRFITATEKGLKVAGLLRDVEKLLQGG